LCKREKREILMADTNQNNALHSDTFAIQTVRCSVDEWC
jgi:hypothetical protein